MQDKKQDKKVVKETKPSETVGIQVTGHIKIFDPNTKEVFIDKRNAIHYENFSEALAQSLSNKSVGQIYQISFGNGGTNVDPTAVITYLPAKATDQNADLYNETYSKVVDDTSTSNTDATRNNLTVIHTSGKVYTDILVSCLLDYGEPNGQQAFDNSTNLDGDFVFDELNVFLLKNPSLFTWPTKRIASCDFPVRSNYPMTRLQNRP